MSLSRGNWSKLSRLAQQWIEDDEEELVREKRRRNRDVPQSNKAVEVSETGSSPPVSARQSPKEKNETIKTHLEEHKNIHHEKTNETPQQQNEISKPCSSDEEERKVSTTETIATQQPRNATQQTQRLITENERQKLVSTKDDKQEHKEHTMSNSQPKNHVSTVQKHPEPVGEKEIAQNHQDDSRPKWKSNNLRRNDKVKALTAQFQEASSPSDKYLKQKNTELSDSKAEASSQPMPVSHKPPASLPQASSQPLKTAVNQPPKKEAEASIQPEPASHRPPASQPQASSQPLNPAESKPPKKEAEVSSQPESASHRPPASQPQASSQPLKYVENQPPKEEAEASSQPESASHKPPARQPQASSQPLKYVENQPPKEEAEASSQPEPASHKPQASQPQASSQPLKSTESQPPKKEAEAASQPDPASHKPPASQPQASSQPLKPAESQPPKKEAEAASQPYPASHKPPASKLQASSQPLKSAVSQPQKKEVQEQLAQAKTTSSTVSIPLSNTTPLQPQTEANTSLSHGTQSKYKTQVFISSVKIPRRSDSSSGIRSPPPVPEAIQEEPSQETKAADSEVFIQPVSATSQDSKQNNHPSPQQTATSFVRLGPLSSSVRTKSQSVDEEDGGFIRRSSLRLSLRSRKLEDRVDKYASAIQKSASVRIPSSHNRVSVVPSDVASKRSVFEKEEENSTKSSGSRKDLTLPGSVTSRISQWSNKLLPSSSASGPKEIKTGDVATKRMLWQQRSQSSSSDTKL
ncbi:ladinin-1 isoform X2 [Hyperolius riggenbachi]|uniref:ladinin-1 isoform X2 n=1 Tax=Hyperolius riggenbachi TaxID=752182 RepID=UPI0035A31439